MFHFQEPELEYKPQYNLICRTSIYHVDSLDLTTLSKQLILGNCFFNKVRYINV